MLGSGSHDVRDLDIDFLEYLSWSKFLAWMSLLRIRKRAKKSVHLMSGIRLHILDKSTLLSILMLGHIPNRTPRSKE